MFVLVFNGLNFLEWSEQVQLHLGVLDFDLAFEVEKSAAITDANRHEAKTHYKAWERSNRLNLIFIRICLANNINSARPKTNNTKEFMKFVEERSKTVNKSLTETLMSMLTTMKFDGSHTMYEHVIEMENITTRLKSLGMVVDEGFLVPFILSLFPFKYGLF